MRRTLWQCFRIIFAAIIVLIGASGKTSASIMDISAMGTKGHGMASAVVALPTDAVSSLYYNPAGLTRLKQVRIEAGTFYGATRFRYKNPQTGYRVKNKYDPIVPWLGLSVPINDKITCGMGFYSTLGTGVEYDGDRSVARHCWRSLIHGRSLVSKPNYRLSDDT